MIDYLRIVNLIANKTNLVYLILKQPITYIMVVVLVLIIFINLIPTNSIENTKNKEQTISGLIGINIILFIIAVLFAKNTQKSNIDHIGYKINDYVNILHETVNANSNESVIEYKDTNFEFNTLNDTLKLYNVNSLNDLLSNIKYLNSYYYTHNIDNNKYDFINKTLNSFYNPVEITTQEVLPEIINNLK